MQNEIGKRGLLYTGEYSNSLGFLVYLHYIIIIRFEPGISSSGCSFFPPRNSLGPFFDK